MAIVRIPVKVSEPGQSGGPWMNVWNARTVSDTGNDFSEQVSETLDALEAFYNSLRPILVSGTDIVLGEGMIRDPLGSPTYVNDDRRVVTGAAVGDRLTALLAVVVSWRTSSATRSGRGRTFVGPFTEGSNGVDGTPELGTLNTIRSASADLLQASSAPYAWSLGVLSTKQKVLRDFTAFTVADRWSYLSSRRD